MTCSDAVRLIAQAAEGHVAPAALDALLQHLDQCESCRTEAENQVLVKRLLASRPEERLPDGLAAAISRRLDREGSMVAPAVDWRRLTIRLLPAAAALALAAGSSIVTVSMTNARARPSRLSGINTCMPGRCRSAILT